jgi:hypothetical protein
MNQQKLPLILGSIMLIAMGLIYSCIKREIPIPPPVKTDSTHTTPPDSTVTVNDTLNLSSGLLVYLNFNGTIADSSGNGNPVSINGATLTTDEHGNANSAFNSNGTGQMVTVTNNGSIKFDTAWSLSINVMANVQQQQMYISMVDYSTGYGPTFSLGTSLPAVYAVAGGSSDSVAGCDNYGYQSLDPYRIVDTSAFQPQAGVWYNIIEIYQRGTLKIYVNGQLVASKVSTGYTAALDCPSSQIVVGGWWSSDPENINGKLDEVRLYNRVLTPQEIAQLAKNL